MRFLNEHLGLSVHFFSITEISTLKELLDHLAFIFYSVTDGFILFQVNLCFDQFVYKLADQIFAYYKILAGRYVKCHIHCVCAKFAINFWSFQLKIC